MMDLEIINKYINEVERKIKRKQADNLLEREIDWSETDQGIGGP